MTPHNVEVVPAQDGRQGLFQAICSCGWISDVEYQSKAHVRAAVHRTATAKDYPQAEK